jgi:AraC family transcriptional regulator
MPMACEVTTVGLTGQFRTPDLKISLYHQQPFSYLPKHVHAGWSMCFVMRGDYRESCSKTRDFKWGDVIVKTAAAIHEDRFGDSGADCLLVELSPQMVQSAGVSSLNVGGCAYRRVSLTKLGMRISRELRLMDDVTPLAIEALVLEAIAELRRSTPSARLRPPAWLRRVRDILESSLPGELTLQMIAGEAGVHPVHMSRVFRRYWGCSIGEFLRNRQVESAAKRLAESDDALALIAHSLGFSDQSHFTRVFKEFTGATPKQYRISTRKL